MASLRSPLAVAFAFVVAAPLVAACGSRSTLDDPDAIDDAGVDAFVPPKDCGNGTCGAGETCNNCPDRLRLLHDVRQRQVRRERELPRLPAGLRRVPVVRRRRLQGDENCVTCAPDCGKCEPAATATCHNTTRTASPAPTTAASARAAATGRARSGENCISCPHDCGVCSVCGNDKCETYETCANCPGLRPVHDAQLLPGVHVRHQVHRPEDEAADRQRLVRRQLPRAGLPRHAVLLRSGVQLRHPEGLRHVRRRLQLHPEGVRDRDRRVPRLDLQVSASYSARTQRT